MSPAAVRRKRTEVLRPTNRGKGTRQDFVEGDSNEGLSIACLAARIDAADANTAAAAVNAQMLSSTRSSAANDQGDHDSASAVLLPHVPACSLALLPNQLLLFAS